MRQAVSPLVPALILAVIAAACASDPHPTPSAPTAGAGSASASPSPDPSPVASPEAVIRTPPGDVYAVPDPIPDGAPGDPIWAEQVAAPAGAVAWRVLYRSETIGGTPIGVSGLIVAPDDPPPTGGFPVIGYAHGTTGLADRCAPSKAARPLADGGSARGSLPLPELWERGFVVAATDYEGLGTPGRHPYLVGGSEGRFVLGVSQGGHASLFAGELAATYAPELDLRGVVALAPGAELAQAALLLAGDE